MRNPIHETFEKKSDIHQTFEGMCQRAEELRKQHFVVGEGAPEIKITTRFEGKLLTVGPYSHHDRAEFYFYWLRAKYTGNKSIDMTSVGERPTIHDLESWANVLRREKRLPVIRQKSG